MVKLMDKIDDYIRLNAAKGNIYEFSKIYKEFLSELSSVSGMISFNKISKKYKKGIKNIKIDKNKKVIKIGLIGELYTLMESFANYDIEKALINNGVSIKRFTNVTYLLFEKKRKVKKYLSEIKTIKYRMGADALDNIYFTNYLINNNYDGIIHIKSSFCTPEIGSMGIINKICEENDMPILFMSMDTNTTKVGFDTRLEAFLDMIEMRKENE